MRGANKPLFLIGIPTFGQHSFLFTQSLLGEIMPSNFSMQLRFIPGMEVGLARNILLQEARNLGCEYIMFRDEDTIAPANVVIDLLQLLETHPDWTFVGGLYATKTRPPEPLVYTDWGTGPAYGFKMGELIPIKFTGMGASLIRMSDLDSIKTEILFERNPWTGAPMEVREFFRTVSASQVKPGSVDKIASTEDAFFFRKLEETGLKAYVDTNLLCGHYDKDKNTVYYPPFDHELARKPDAWNHEPRVVNLGAGADYSPYEIQVDLLGGENIDYKCDVSLLPTEWENQFDIAKAHHVLEHFDFERSPKVLAEWLRILKPGGKLKIEVPDLQQVAEAIAGGRWDALIQGNIYGDQGHPYFKQGPYGGYDGVRWLPHSYQHNHHNSGYTARFLLDLLKDVGYVDAIATMRKDYWEISIEAYKPKSEEVKDESLDNRERTEPDGR